MVGWSDIVMSYVCLAKGLARQLLRDVVKFATPKLEGQVEGTPQFKYLDQTHSFSGTPFL